MKRLLISLALGIAFSVVSADQVFAVQNVSGMDCTSGVCFPIDTGLSDKPIIDILGNLLQWLFGVFFFLSLIAFLVSGSQYLISAGDDDMIDTAKRNMKWSVVGVIVGLAGFVIVTAVAGALSANPIF